MDSQLVDRIVQEVIAALKAQGALREAAPSPAASPVAEPVQPKAGSRPAKSSDLPPKQFIVTREPVFNRKTLQPAGDRKTFITAEMLLQRLAAGEAKGQVELAHNEFLTPAAQDLAESRHIAVRRKPKAAAPPPVAQEGDSASRNVASQRTAGHAGQLASQATPGALGVVVSGGGEKVAAAIAALSRDGLALSDYSLTDCWIQNLLALAEAVRNRRVGAGVLIVPHAADAMVMAGKIKGLRPVQGTRPDSVAAAVRRFDANLLVLEHAFMTMHELRAMVRQFAQPRGAPTYEHLLARIAEQEGG